tara:strand:+ start:7181 stop:7579 length:399 start_codon:yes stop_codon:yes gene_type:complete
MSYSELTKAIISLDYSNYDVLYVVDKNNCSIHRVSNELLYYRFADLSSGHVVDIKSSKLKELDKRLEGFYPLWVQEGNKIDNLFGYECWRVNSIYCYSLGTLDFRLKIKNARFNHVEEVTLDKIKNIIISNG